MKTLRLISIVLLLTPIFGTAQTTGGKTDKQEFSKHEIGISWGAFPTSGVWMGTVIFRNPSMQQTGARLPGLTNRHPYFAHRDHKGWYGPLLTDGNTGISYKEDESYDMQHYGCLTFNYQYHFTKKHSIGFTASWLGRYISIYAKEPHTDEVINTKARKGSKGWENIFTLCINYRFTYYSKDAVSLYTGIHLGFGMGFIERKLLFESEDSFYAMPGIQVTGFGIEAGKTHAFVSELGFGCQGLLKIGYRYKFNNK